MSPGFTSFAIDLVTWLDMFCYLFYDDWHSSSMQMASFLEVQHSHFCLGFLDELITGLNHDLVTNIFLDIVCSLSSLHFIHCVSFLLNITGILLLLIGFFFLVCV